jgi:hypothetical protein
MNQDLPAFVVIKDTDAQVVNGVRNWGSRLHARGVSRAWSLSPDRHPHLLI